MLLPTTVLAMEEIDGLMVGTVEKQSMTVGSLRPCS